MEMNTTDNITAEEQAIVDKLTKRRKTRNRLTITFAITAVIAIICLSVMVGFTVKIDRRMDALMITGDGLSDVGVTVSGNYTYRLFADDLFDGTVIVDGINDAETTAMFMMNIRNPLFARDIGDSSILAHLNSPASTVCRYVAQGFIKGGFSEFALWNTKDDFVILYPPDKAANLLERYSGIHDPLGTFYHASLNYNAYSVK